MTRPHLLPSTLTTLVTLWLVVAAGTRRSLVAKVDPVSDGDTLIAITREGSKLRLRFMCIDISVIPQDTKPRQH